MPGTYLTKNSVGVCIPCHAPNVKYLRICLQSIEQQTVKPDFVAISISGVAYTPFFSSKSFPIYITTSNEAACAGTNRNRAASLIASLTDIITFFDADDIMHPRRIEFIHHHFMHENIDILLHSTQVHSIRVIQGKDLSELPWNGLTGRIYTDHFITGRDCVCGRVWFDAEKVLGDKEHPRHLGTCGHVTCRTPVWLKVKVPEKFGPYGGEDSEYVYRMYAEGYKLGFTPDILSWYIQSRDTVTMLPVPFAYSIPDEYVVSAVPEKVRDFSEVIPGTRSNYTYGPGEYEGYLQQYRESRFAHTKKKGGWDCLRHYEILASGCIPVVESLQDIPVYTMTTYPKEILSAAYADLLPWTGSEGQLTLYREYVEKLLEHCRKNCTTSASARRFLEMVPCKKPKILMILCHPGENYSREFLSIGLRRALGENFIDYPKNHVLYSGCDLSKKHGNGFGYGGLLDDIDVDRDTISDRIMGGEFDCIIYGKVGHDETAVGSYPNLPHIELVRQLYTRDRIFFLYGGDGCQSLSHRTYYTQHLLKHMEMATCAVRELEY